MSPGRQGDGLRIERRSQPAGQVRIGGIDQDHVRARRQVAKPIDAVGVGNIQVAGHGSARIDEAVTVQVAIEQRVDVGQWGVGPGAKPVAVDVLADGVAHCGGRRLVVAEVHRRDGRFVGGSGLACCSRGVEAAIGSAKDGQEVRVGLVDLDQVVQV